ncbi:Ceramide glucosyltransferase [Podospora pseudopauciseta]|uniref:Ceramide glucosyltransferase n=2 Tax=Podospora TaxID=5144 RepID=A0ABR0HPS9_9PEZI|nr:Ceramide glucosyltransferase [Podospora pseudopauciseta]KAK4679826.1 Ceramide glucosyltransferase [Podospora pseudoanserina]
MPAHNDQMPMIVQGAALVSFVWTCIIVSVQGIGICKILRNNSAPHPKPFSPTLEKDEVPHITVIRPVKGAEAGLYECLASTFQLAYPKSKLTIYLCVDSTRDPAYPVLQKVVAAYSDFDAKVFVEEQDPVLHGDGGHIDKLGPNPKIRNISRAYREAKGDIIWIADCNVWLGANSAGRMVDKLDGFLPDGTRTKPYKFVHQLPLVIDLETPKTATEEEQALLSGPINTSAPKSLLDYGGRLEEMFMATTHAKFYSAINTVGIAPCVVGKSNMFRKSHLERLTDPARNPLIPPADAARGRGVDYFSSYICEDHLIGDLIFKSKIPGFKNHGLVHGEVAIQPMSGMTVAAYIARRVRWLRVRKWTVLTATLVEPGVESLIGCLHMAFAFTTLPWFRSFFGIPPTWKAFGTIWISAVTVWMVVDRLLSAKLHKLQSVDVDENTPAFALGSTRTGGIKKKPFLTWFAAWLGREFLAFPIWTWAVLLGATVNWRGQTFRVRPDMSVTRLDDVERTSLRPSTPVAAEGANSCRSTSKDRVD